MSIDRRGLLAIYLPSLAGGGAEREMLHLAVALWQKGLQVELWLAHVSGSYTHLVPAGLPLIQLGGGGVLQSLLPLASCLRRRRPQALLTAMTHANVVALLACLLSAPRGQSEMRVVVSERASLRSLLRAEPRMTSAVLQLMLRWLYPRANAVISVSEGVAEELRAHVRLPVERVLTIPNPINLSACRVAATEPFYHPWLGPDQPPVLMAAGRLVEQKDFVTLLEAFALVRQRHRIRLVILGVGPLREHLEQHSRVLGIADALLLPGFIVNPMAWMARAAVFVLSSRWEGLPGVLLQAMACGVPVVSTDCPHGPREILEGGRWGTLVPVGNAEAMAAAIEQQLKSSPAPSGLTSMDGHVSLRPPSPRCADYNPDRIYGAYRQVLGV